VFPLPVTTTASSAASLGEVPSGVRVGAKAVPDLMAPLCPEGVACKSREVRRKMGVRVSGWLVPSRFDRVFRSKKATWV
jgi:hypothetical protein